MCVGGGGGGEYVFVCCLYYVFAFNPVWVQVSNKIYSILFYSILFYSILFYSILFYSILLSQSLTLFNQASRYILKCIRVAYSDVHYGVSNHCFWSNYCHTSTIRMPADRSFVSIRKDPYLIRNHP